MDPITERHRLQLRPLPYTAEALLRQHQAPPRLIAHLILVPDVASQLLDSFHSYSLADAINDAAVLFGAATHDIGKVIHTSELSGSGHQHEHAGKLLLLQAGIPSALARFAETHGQHAVAANTTIEDLLVSLADTCWKGKRDRELEERIVEERAAQGSYDRWVTFLNIDDIIEQIAAGAERRLAWQALFAVDG